MAADSLLHFHDQLNQPDGIGPCSGENICIDQDEELDNLFHELDDILDADDLLHSLETFNYDGDIEELDFDTDFRFWGCNPLYMKSNSCSTDAGMAMGSLASCAWPSPVSTPSPAGSPSPHSLHGESQVPPSQMLPVSIPSESSSCSGVIQEEMQQRQTERPTRVRSAQLSKPPVPLAPKVALPLETVISDIPVPQTTAPLQPKIVMIHTLQATPVTTLPPVATQPAHLTGHAVMLSQPAQVVQMCPQVMSAPPMDHMPAHVVTALATICDPVGLPGGRAFQTETPPLMTSSLRNPGTREDATRQQRLIRNRESASLSRKKKKEYLVGLEARLQVALFENEKLKTVNGTLRKQLEGLLNENTSLKSSSPKHRNLCLLVVLLFLALSVGPVSLRQGEHISELSASATPTHTGRHLLGFSVPETSDPLRDHRPDSSAYSMSDEKALMMVKRYPTMPCQPAVNRTKFLQISHELRGWVSRHEEERIRWMERKIDGRQFSMKSAEKTSDKTSGDAILSISSPDLSEKNSSKELQVNYGPYERYRDLFEKTRRHNDTFYVISFHREYLLLPATHHNKGTRPKMSVVLPAMNDSMIKDNGHEVMMQIDCEVTDTRILHMKTSSVPLFLRVNQTGSTYRSDPANGQVAPAVGVLMPSTSPTL
ncbi:cyclic AMP-dependent transcription factor ATF-6 alpha isoform X2 [Brienomyrus brachyistius]|uniref:cyclic AMP-dependent transcription factor ATF-6 alpha isoform X2 n=1 Tax=Brienomyrus brachyistius TaxID=42636 RepID=UPI0020B3DE29|nr:cyclic AMP-dependent transcription factor ATF-6 alpha isoform X2 [Brienomyrus brachyistius]